MTIISCWQDAKISLAQLLQWLTYPAITLLTATALPTKGKTLTQLVPAEIWDP